MDHVLCSSHSSAPAVMDSGSVALSRSAVLALCVLLSGSAAAVLLCHYCPLQAAGTRCNITTECLEHERCSSGWRRYGRVHVLALQGCLSPELCGSNQTLTHKGLEYEITYTCCCRDLCNTAAAPESLLQLLGVTVSPRIHRAALSPETHTPLLKHTLSHTHKHTHTVLRSASG